MTTIIVTSRAALDIEEICVYYRLHAPRVEHRFQEALRLTIEQIRKNAWHRCNA